MVLDKEILELKFKTKLSFHLRKSNESRAQDSETELSAVIPVNHSTSLAQRGFHWKMQLIFKMVECASSAVRD